MKQCFQQHCRIPKARRGSHFHSGPFISSSDMVGIVQTWSAAYSNHEAVCPARVCYCRVRSASEVILGSFYVHLRYSADELAGPAVLFLLIVLVFAFASSGYRIGAYVAVSNSPWLQPDVVGHPEIFMPFGGHEGKGLELSDIACEGTLTHRLHALDC